MSAASKLSAVDVVEIRTRRAAGELATDLAVEYGVSISLVCQVCYGEIWKEVPGPITGRRRAHRPAEDRFWSKVDKENGPVHPTLGRCWTWTGTTDGRGYGNIGVVGNGKRKQWTAHRFAYFIANGSVTDGLVVRHHCDNPPCCNPAHLAEGTYADNASDRDTRGRGARGETVGTAKLSEASVLEIRRRRASGETGVRLAAEFGVSTSLVCAITQGKFWRHLSPSTPATGATP